ncbi:murein biosynthesis integral membrane protein MurJ [Virgibacillus profundi]|uniref:Lipid II flippase n=1 Tax=Virgibacillus profundi TaxID=2024555 RepID=A0A2A2IJH2_9BACI|nr:murein biosynthesis integral membrane protein MurJ [Virgibacillus profundi]PAV31300.1 murein biosynthesis integral membrane protein MurJ [Virgibacillus profundi]PXY55485.1 murein biosynthesis integral membrane protein MurJ [Virgibacillus profundi]
MKSKLGLASILFLIATIFLKISGLIRDMVIAFYFGDSYVADAYLAAFIIPNMIILFFTTGMKNALVPSYIQSVEEKRGSYHLSQVFRGTFGISILLSLLGMVLAKYYIPLLYPAFSPEGQEIAIWTTIILFSSVVFVGMNAVLEAYFDSENKFSLSMVSQIIVIGSTIMGAVFFARSIGAYSLALGYLIGTIMSLLFKALLVAPRKLIKFKMKTDWKEIKRFYIIFIPVAITVAVGQINLAVDNIYASYFDEGVVTYINYAKNLVHFPQAIFGVVIGTVIFPFLSRANAQSNFNQFKRGIEIGLNTMFFILLPAIAGMMVLMPNIIELLYQRGAFSADATNTTATVAYYYFGSVLFFSLHNVVTKGFYTLKKGHLILIIGGISVILNVILNFVFTRWLGYNGIPLASSVVAFLYVGASFVLLLKLVKGLNLKKLGAEYIKVIIAGIIMVACILLLKSLINDWVNIVQIILISVTGVITYFISALLLRIKSLSFLIKRFLPKKAAEKRLDE